MQRTDTLAENDSGTKATIKLLTVLIVLMADGGRGAEADNLRLWPPFFSEIVESPFALPDNFCCLSDIE